MSDPEFRALVKDRVRHEIDNCPITEESLRLQRWLHRQEMDEREKTVERVREIRGDKHGE
jgi:hypothetical protein